MKIKLLKVAAALGTGAILLTSFASAQTALTATCTGTVTGTSIAWAATPTGGTAPYTYVWTGAPNITGHTTASFTETYTANGTYTASVAVTDTATPTAATVTATCSAIVTAVVTTPPPTTMVKKPDLNINPNGKILIHGMKVTTVGTNTFQGTVWGITYTVNLVNPTVNKPLFLFKDGKEATSGVDISQHLKVGDEVGVQGQITAATPLVINGQIVRNYSILKARPHDSESNKGEKDDDKNENKGNSMMNNSGNEGQRALLLQLLQQVQALQKQFQEKFGTNSSTGTQ